MSTTVTQTSINRTNRPLSWKLPILCNVF